jgi:hypothetical protein
MLKRALYLLTAIILVSGLVFSFTLPAKADFQHNLIIDDATFNNTGSMSLGQINNFLNQFPSSCISSNNGFTAPDPTGYSPTGGFTYGGNVPGYQVIYDAAQAYGLNPQVLITTLEKESSVVTGSASYHCQYINTAMGYGCPDGGSCPTDPATESGFSQQVIHAAWLLKFGEERSEGNVNWDVQLNNFPVAGDHWDNSDDPQSCYGGPMTQGTWQVCPSGGISYYDGYTVIDGTSVHMDDGATASLYWYTPHFSGNQNFVNIFSNWFGGLTKCSDISSTNSGIMRLTNPQSGSQFLTQSTSEACGAVQSGFLYDGQMFIPDTTDQDIPIYRLSNNGNYLYTASASERNNSGFTYNGIAFYGVDPDTDPNARPVYRLSNSSGDFLYTISSAERDYFIQNDGYQYNGISFYADENQGNSVTPVYRLSNNLGAFFYTTSAQEMSSAENDGFQYNGISFNAIAMFNAIDVPIYRLATAHGYLLTTSLPERLGAYKAGYVDQGAAMFTYGTHDNTQTYIYRLSNSVGNFLYTGSLSEVSGAQSAGYNLNGIAFSTPGN